MQTEMNLQGNEGGGLNLLRAARTYIYESCRVESEAALQGPCTVQTMKKSQCLRPPSAVISSAELDAWRYECLSLHVWICNSAGASVAVMT